MRILLASSEVHPYSKTGGLADMVGALGKSLARAGHEVGLVTPLYAGCRGRVPDLKRLCALDLPLADLRYAGEIWTSQPSAGLTLYFVDQPDFYHRESLYQDVSGDYPDNAERFLFLSKVVVRLARTLDPAPDLVHVHDWQVGMVPLLIQHEKLAKGWGNAPRTVCTIHNLAYQGLFPADDYRLANLPWSYFTPDGVEFYGWFNCLKAGIAYSDLISTVSPRYAREIMTPEFGCGLDPLLRYRKDRLFGILNGVDYEEWNTTNNPNIPHPYSVDDLSGKDLNKAALQAEMGLPVDSDVPLFGSVNRLVEQKGVDIQLGALEEMLGSGLQFVLLGSGAAVFENGYRSLARRYPRQVAIRIGYNAGLAHRIEAGCDFFLLPSRFEPCGLNQMYSLRYGTVPIVRVTGGLDDTVVDVSESVERADGIKFREYSSRALARAIRKALVLHDEPELLEHYRRNGMRADFSWDRTAREYEKLYGELKSPPR